MESETFSVCIFWTELNNNWFNFDWFDWRAVCWLKIEIVNGKSWRSSFLIFLNVCWLSQLLNWEKIWIFEVFVKFKFNFLLTHWTILCPNKWPRAISFQQIKSNNSKQEEAFDERKVKGRRKSSFQFNLQFEMKCLCFECLF